MSSIKKYFKNSLSNLLLNMLQYVLSLITMPIYLEEFGEDMWGVYLFALGMNSMLSRFNLGLRASLRKYTARYASHGDKEEMQHAFQSTITIFSVIAVVNFLIVGILAFFIVEILHLRPDQESVARSTMLIAAAYSIVFWCSMIVQSVMEGYQHYFARNMNVLISTVGMIGVFFGVLYADLSFLQVISLTFVSLSLPVVLNVLFILRKKLLKGIKFRFGIKREDFKSDFFAHSADMLVLSLVTILEFQSDKFLLGAIKGATMITIYAIISKPMFLVNMVNVKVFSVLSPEFAQLQVSGDREKSLKVLSKATEVNFLITVPIVGVLVLVLQEFLQVWLGARYYELELDGFLIWGYLGALSYVISPAFWNQRKYYSNTGKSRFVRNLHLVTAILNFVISFITIFWLGLGGVIVGTLVMNIARAIWYNWYSITVEKIPLKRLISSSSIISIVYVLVVTGLLWMAKGDYIIEARWWSFLGWSSLFGMAIFAYSAYYFLFKMKLIKKLIR